MKKITLSILLASFLLVSFNRAGYESAMKKNIQAMNTADGPEELLLVSNKFERIGEAEKDKWLPYYYAAFSHVLMTNSSQDVTLWDGYLDSADGYLEKSGKIKGADVVEILTLKGFSKMMRINVAPSVRGQEYSMKAAAFLQQAQQMDNENPRVILMMAQMQYGTAQFFGSGTEDVCKQFDLALSKFEKEDAGDRGILPSWGKPQAESKIKQCKG